MSITAAVNVFKNEKDKVVAAILRHYEESRPEDALALYLLSTESINNESKVPRFLWVL